MATKRILEAVDSLTYPVGQYGLTGAVLAGQEGAAATVQLNGAAISYPATLAANDVLSVIRAQAATDPDYNKITRIYGTPAPGTDGLNPRGAWAANTVYAQYDMVTQGGASWYANQAFTSGSSFNAANWTRLGATALTGASDTNISAPGSLQALLYSGGAWANVTLSLLAGHISDVAIASPVAGQVLAYSTGSSKWVNQALVLANLGNVNLTNPTDKDVLSYDAASGKWINRAATASGGGVSGPASSTAYALAMYSDATGTTLLNGSLITTAKGGLYSTALASGATAGNARGTGSIDLQNYRYAAANVASGQFSVLISYDGQASADYSVVIGGKSSVANAICAGVFAGGVGTASGSYAVVLGGVVNTASGDSAATLGGRYNQATGISSVTLGGTQANARRYGQASRTNQGASSGESQWSHVTLGRRASNALTNLELTLDNNAPVNGTGATANRFWLTPGMMATFRGIIQATTGSSQYEGAAWLVQGTAMCNATGVTVSGVTITAVGNFAPGASTAASWSVAIQGAAVASGAGYLQFLVTNGAPLTGYVRWLASIDFVEII